MQLFSQSDFTRLLLTEFPELSEAIAECDGLLHIEMGEFSTFTEEAMNRGDWATFDRAVRVADQLYARPDPRLLNALNVSYLEHLAFDGARGGEAWLRLTPRLREGWRQMMDYLDDLAKRARQLEQ